MICQRIDAGNRDAVNALIRQRWFTTVMVIRGEAVDMIRLDGFLIRQDGEILGLITYRVSGETLEITSLDSFREGQGIGSALLEAAVQEAGERGCRRMSLITTNDNLNALRFYQKRGFDLTALFPNAVDLARKQKPEIPLIGDYGIPLHHEIELQRQIGAQCV